MVIDLKVAQVWIILQSLYNCQHDTENSAARILQLKSITVVTKKELLTL